MDEAVNLGETSALTCVHESCWQCLVHDPLDGSNCCLACGAHLLLHCSQHWSASRAVAAAEALVSALRDLPGSLPDPLRTAAAPPIWSLLATALHSFMGHTSDAEALHAAAQGMCRAVTLLSLSEIPDAQDMFKVVVEDVVGSFCLASSGSPEKTEARLTVLATMAALNGAAVGKVIALKTGEVEAVFLRLLASSSSPECTLQQLVCLLSRLCEEGISLQNALLLQVLYQSAEFLHSSRSPELHEEILHVLVECLASAEVLFLESLVRCLFSFSQCPAFFDNLIIAYVVQPLLMSATQLMSSKRIGAAAKALKLLRLVLSRQQSFRANLELVKLFVQHLSDQMATGHQVLVLAAMEVFGELCSGLVLPTPVPLSLLRKHVQGSMDALSAALTLVCGGNSGGEVESDSPAAPLSSSQEQCFMEGQLLCTGLRLLVRWAQVHKNACQDPVHSEDSYGLESTAEDGLDWLVSFVIRQLSCVFMAHCQHFQQPRPCEMFLECLCLVFGIAAEHNVIEAPKVLEESTALLSFLWDIRAHHKKLIQLSGVALSWLLWFTAGDYKDAALLTIIQTGCQHLRDSFPECLQLLLQSHTTHSEVQLAILMLCILQWEELSHSEDESSVPEPEGVEQPLCYATAIANYVLTNGCQSLLVLSLVCKMIPSIVHSGRGDQKAVTAASEWLCKHLQERAHWKDVLLSTQDSLLWCVSTHNHQELLGDYAFCKWMELPELPEGLEVHLSKSKVALKPLVRLITSVNEGLSEKAVHFLKILLQKSPASQVVGLRLRTVLVSLFVEKFTDIWHQRTAATEGLWQLLGLVVLCRDGSVEGLIVGEELQVLFQKVMQLTLKSNVLHASTALAYFVFVLKAADMDTHSAATLLISNDQWLQWFESQLAAGTPHAWPLLAALFGIHQRFKLSTTYTIRITKQNFLRELGHGDPDRALPALTALPGLLGKSSLAQISLHYPDCSNIVYILASHIAKQDTQLQTSALNCLEVVLPYAQILADMEGYLNDLSAHPWLIHVLLLSSSDEDCARLLNGMLQGDIVSELLASHLPLIVERLHKDGSSQAQAVAAKLLSGVYSAWLSKDVEGELRELLSPIVPATGGDTPGVSDLSDYEALAFYIL
ncbi:uncharacterized protein LOC119160784 isoform X4 [Rhipicephalus microplus]|uniref:uncharacterized protein LOC119160784 isoform X4 n=1 Tax=Rhipicephalus microplus TaxID=6941 RepID=UPI003F6B5A63